MKYVKFTFKNEEPLKIADDSTTQSGQVNALSYVPGTALRGALIGSFVKVGKFDGLKDMLLSDDVVFHNAYIVVNEKELVPSPKGFYEDKTASGDEAKEIENLLTKGEFTPGNKRAALGKYCYFDGDCIFYTHVEMGSDMKINKGNRNGEKKNVFRNQYIKPGYTFSAYISFSDDAVKAGVHEEMEEILTQMKDEDALTLGGSRSFGYGKCSIEKIDVSDQMPYAELSGSCVKDLQDVAYMMLLSDTAMINKNGVAVGLDTDILKDKLGLNKLEIELCSTSVVNRQGYNRTWQTWLPSNKMYEMGSVFKLSFPREKISGEAAIGIMQEGIGIRTNEGFGCVVFFTRDSYENLAKKKEIKVNSAPVAVSDGALNTDEDKTLRIAAKGHYMKLIDRAVTACLADKNDFLDGFRLNSSQLGTIESIILTNLYSKNENEAFTKLDEYFCSAKDNDSRKRVLNGGVGRGDIASYIAKVQKQPLMEFFTSLPDEVMGFKYNEILSSQDIARVKLEFIVKLIKSQNRNKEV